MISRAPIVAVLVVALAAPAAAGAEPTQIDLADPPLARLKVPGANELSAIPAGDVNGDGIADVAYGNVGSSTAGRQWNGSVRVVLGPIRDSDNAAAEAGFTVHGPRSNGCTGREVAAGDVNGDGLSDLVIGGNASCDAYDKHGRAIVVFGSRHPVDVDPATPGPWGYVIEGTGDTGFAGSEPQFGSAVAVSPDMNGDGRDEVVATSLAANSDLPGYASAGAGYVFWGKGDTAGETADDAALRVHGRNNSANLGWSVAPAGDANGDDVPDVAFSAPFARDPSGTNRGEVVVLYGTSEPATLDDTAMGQAGFTVSGAPGDYLGLYTHSLAGVGDQNGDGRDDLLVGSVYSGRSYVVYSPGAGQRVDLSQANPSAYRLVGGSGYGYVVGALGDQDGDRVPELATSDYAGSTRARTRNGVLYVIPGGVRSGDVRAADAAAFTIHGAFDGDTVTQASSFPDLTRDGRPELLLSRSNGYGGDSYIDLITLGEGRPPLVDLIPPEIRCEVAASVWHSVNVEIHCSARDENTGLAVDADAAFALRTEVPEGVETDAALTDTRSVCDRAGNCATAGPVGGNRIDRRGPEVEVTCPPGPVLLGSSASAAVAASDGGSGLAHDPTGTLVLDTGAVGIRSISATATDNAGNLGSGACAYLVLSVPGPPVDDLPDVISVRAGQKKTFTFSLDGAPKSRAIASGYPTERKLACRTSRAAGKARRIDARLRPRAQKNAYSFTWRTKRKMRGSCRELSVRVAGTTVYRTWVSLR